MTKKEAMDFVSTDGSELKNLPVNFRDDKEIVLAAISNYGSSLEYASSEIKADKKIVMKAVKNGGYALQFASDNLKADRDIVLEAVKSYGWVLQYASIPLRNDKQIVIESLREYGQFIRYASDKLKRDKEVVLKAIYNWNDKWFVRDFFDIVPPEIYNDPDVMIAVLQKLNIIDNIEVISKSSTLLNDNEFIQKLIELELVSSKTNLKYKKKIGNYTIVADTPPQLKGYTTPGGESLDKNEIWKDNTFYEQDYFAIYSLRNLHVVDENNKICSPIIEEIEVKNSGYVCTWSSVFWVQGFAILKDEIFFISTGEDVGYYSKKPEFHKLTNNNYGVKISFQDFIKTLPKPIVQDIKINRSYVDWWDGKENLNDYMLL